MLDSEWQDQSVKHSHLALANHRKSVLMRKTLSSLARHVTDLCTSETMLKQYERMANVGSWQMEKDTRKVTCSKNLYRILGLNPNSDRYDQDFFVSRFHPDDRERARSEGNQALAEGREFEQDVRYMHPNGSTRILRVQFSHTVDLSGEITGLAGMTQDVTDRVRVEEDLHRLSQQLMNQRDDDRRLMARELHDSAGQSLSALRMTLDSLQEALGQAEWRPVSEMLEILQSSAQLAEVAEREVRTISYLTHPPLLDEAGLVPALRWLARGFAARSGIKVEIDIPDDFGRLRREAETALFRIVQESLTNVHRYSGASKATIRLAREFGLIRVEIQDHGRGFLIHSLTKDSQPLFGVGIAGMRERMKQLRGALEVESAPGRGTTIRAIFPTSSTDVPNRSRSDQQGYTEPPAHALNDQVLNAHSPVQARPDPVNSDQAHSPGYGPSDTNDGRKPDAQVQGKSRRKARRDNARRL